VEKIKNMDEFQAILGKLTLVQLSGRVEA